MKYKIKYLIIYLLCFSITASCFIACGNKNSGPVTITIWHDKEEAVADTLQKKLDTLAPDIIVKLERGSVK